MTSQRGVPGENRSVALRPPHLVMDLARLGSLYPYRLSFMRVLVRRLMREKWSITEKIFDLNDSGYGAAVYEIQTDNGLYSFVAFADQLDQELRSDRVIAEAWDMTATLCEGAINSERLNFFRKNVPLQEKGRLDSRCIVMTRANKSVRNFDYVVSCLAAGDEPSWDQIAKVGYLYRTTAVYGSGKFGMADWEKVSADYADFAQPFSAEMFACFMIRHFSLAQAEWVAKSRAPATAIPIRADMKRYVGIGNATGLGMAPYLINHPLLISRWVETRETALAAVIGAPVSDAKKERFANIAKRAAQHLDEIATDNEEQNAANQQTRKELLCFLSWFEKVCENTTDWRTTIDFATATFGIETQELINTLLIEAHPDLVDGLCDRLSIQEDYPLRPDMTAAALIELIKGNYAWALEYDFEDNKSQDVFWYRSEEKMEPRLGRRNNEPGDDREMLIGVARSIRRCFDDLSGFIAKHQNRLVAHFLIAHPEHRLIVRRIQTMALTTYGDIRTNLLDRDVLPIHLLRCKLSFFGVGKFDPRSRLWVRNTMFQGAPICDDIGGEFSDDWCFPVKPGEEMSSDDRDDHAVA